MFIYKITNLITHKVYIGQTICSVEKRWQEHIRAAFNYNHENKIYRSMRKHGIEHFKIEIIYNANNIDDLNKKEEEYINTYNSINEGYNIRHGGKNMSHHQETKDKISESNRNRIWTDDMKHNMSEAISNWHTKNPQSRSVEARAKTSKANKSTWEKYPKCRQKALDKFQEHNKKTSKKVYCVELDRVFNSISHASRELSINIAYISQTCKGVYKKAKGFSFKFMDDC